MATPWVSSRPAPANPFSPVAAAALGAISWGALKKTLSTFPLAPFRVRKEKKIVSEGHPFDDAQGGLSDSRQRGLAPLYSLFFSSLLV